MRSITKVMAIAAVFCCATTTWAQDAAPAEPAKQETLPSADDVIQNLINAMGGADAHKKITSRITEEKMVLESMGMEFLSKTMHKENNVRQEVNMASMGKQMQGRTGDVIWVSDPMQGSRVLEGEEAASMMRMSRLFPYLRTKLDYPHRKTVGIEKVGDSDCYKLEMKPESGDAVYWFIDKASHNLRRVGMTFKSPMGELPMTMDLMDFRKIDGIVYPHKVNLDQGGMMKIVIETVSVQHNAEIADATFTLPPDIQKIVDKKKAAGEAKEAEPAKEAGGEPAPTSQPKG